MLGNEVPKSSLSHTESLPKAPQALRTRSRPRRLAHHRDQDQQRLAASPIDPPPTERPTPGGCVDTLPQATVEAGHGHAVSPTSDGGESRTPRRSLEWSHEPGAAMRSPAWNERAPERRIPVKKQDEKERHEDRCLLRPPADARQEGSISARGGWTRLTAPSPSTCCTPAERRTTRGRARGPPLD